MSEHVITRVGQQSVSVKVGFPGPPGPAWITAWVGAFTAGTPYAAGNAGVATYFDPIEDRWSNLTLRAKHAVTIPDIGSLTDLDYLLQHFDILILASNGRDGANGSDGENGDNGAPGQSVTVLSFANADVAGFNAAVSANAGNPLVFVVRRSA